MRVIIAVTGASGVVLGKRLLDVLRDTKHEIHLIISESAKKVIKHELGKIDEIERPADFLYKEDDLEARISSSSYRVDAMVIIPCSMKTLSAIANGFSDNLITRSAENILKLGKNLVVVPRDTPLTLAAIDNMKKLKLAGAVILPPNMAYYYKPRTVDDVTNFFVGKILDVLDIEHKLYKKWKGR